MLIDPVSFAKCINERIFKPGMADIASVTINYSSSPIQMPHQVPSMEELIDLLQTYETEQLTLYSSDPGPETQSAAIAQIADLTDRVEKIESYLKALQDESQEPPALPPPPAPPQHQGQFSQADALAAAAQDAASHAAATAASSGTVVP